MSALKEFHLEDMDMDVKEIEQQSILEHAVTEYQVYGKDSMTPYVISKHGIKGNEFSERNPNFGRWMVMENRGNGTAKVLINPNQKLSEALRGEVWLSALSREYSHSWGSPGFTFDSAKEALAQLQKSVNEPITE